MDIKTLGQIDKTYIEDIVKKICSKKVHYNEAQLQFNLAWGIREDIVVNNLVVLLEELTATGIYNINNKKINISWYTDIVIYDRTTGEFVCIEVKYKTKEDKNLGLKNHGAYDLGCYDFLWDVKRNEMLKSSIVNKLILNNNDEKEIQRTKNLYKFIKGYSIIITNDDIYWKNKEDSNSCAKEFFLDDKRIIQKGKILNWLSSAKFYKNTWRDMSLSFDKDYYCEWFPIKNSKIQTIKGMIFETA